MYLSSGMERSDHDVRVYFYSLFMCPHPKQPWLAIGLTSGKDSHNHLLVYNYKTKEHLPGADISNYYTVA